MDNILLRGMYLIAIISEGISSAEPTCRQLCDDQSNAMCVKGATCTVTYSKYVTIVSTLRQKVG